jgi:hypothetical protein
MILDEAPMRALSPRFGLAVRLPPNTVQRGVDLAMGPTPGETTHWTGRGNWPRCPPEHLSLTLTHFSSSAQKIEAPKHHPKPPAEIDALKVATNALEGCRCPESLKVSYQGP